MGVMTVSVLLCVLTFLGTEVTGTSRPWYHRLSRQVERFARRSEPLSDPYQCPPGFSRPSRYWSTCYHFDNSLKSWSAANNACRQRGGSLASITDSNVYEYALSLVEDGYTWVEGSHEQSGIQQKYWLTGSVRNQNGKHEGCLALVKFDDRTGFDDISCSSQDNTAFTLCEI
ncbi:galactose-specific lectin nattectin isoform X1 [Coregonus clupeaformis]|uniref:galactose-specific lectin nattectin isoform X1 n=1 Tax=Coregonus clupeaformis TaxID=59861 RepID=UPI001BE0218F|nr:galactose-specific lectin nattectin isoform X1 [Coregonus clupeaformis]